MPRRARLDLPARRSSPATTCTAASRRTSRVPARGLCPVPDLDDPRRNPPGSTWPTLSVIADAVSTPVPGDPAQRARPRATSRSSSASAAWAASACRSRPRSGAHGRRDRRRRGARSRALARARRDAARSTRASLTFKELQAARCAPSPTSATSRAGARASSRPRARPAGQETAFGLLGPGGHLSVVGYTPDEGRAAALQPDGVRRHRAGQLGLPARALPGGARPRARRPGRARRRSSSAARCRRSTRRSTTSTPRTRRRGASSSIPERLNAMEFKNHDLVAAARRARRAATRSSRCATPRGASSTGLHAVRITLDNPAQFNSYTTEMVKGVILGMRARLQRPRRGRGRVHRRGRRARSAPAATPREYAEYYAGRPEEYRAVHAAVQRHGQRDPARATSR